jgi:superfamily II DNA or RNA helicase
VGPGAQAAAAWGERRQTLLLRGTMEPVRIRWRAGTLEVDGLDAEQAEALSGLRLDRRAGRYRAPAMAWAELLRSFKAAGIPFEDEARAYPDLDRPARALREPRPFQSEALAAWEQGGRRGLVVLPTGAGKTEVGIRAIATTKRAALVIAPTLDLVWQWHDRLTTAFGDPVGVVGGGDHDVQPITVTTYDSAHLHVEHLGNRFGLLIFDECHHLPGPSYGQSARLSLAPYRLGLSATPERGDGGHDALEELIGPERFRIEIDQLKGEWLADYDVCTVEVELSDEERRAWEEARATYLGFLRSQGIRVGRPGGWGEFIRRAAGSDGGRAALLAHRRQKELAEAAPAKLDVLEGLLHEHRHDRTLIFTQDNRTAYAIARRFLIAPITHQTKIKERTAVLNALREGTLRAVVTSKVLNEGVDVPAASVAIVVSGSGSVREHVQRLGRVLRKQGDERAVLYELITRDTAESSTSERRRDHIAYR